MAITNADIIFHETMRLLEAGKIKATGRTIEVRNSEGKTLLIPEAEPIHTFAKWKELGYKVKRGEHAITKLTIWKYNTRRIHDDEADPEERIERGYCFQKTAHFFSASQVEPIIAPGRKTA